MRDLRRLVFWLHLPAGVLAGGVILVMSLTGVLLAFETQIVRWADGDARLSPPPSPDAARLPVEALVAAAGASGESRGRARTVTGAANLVFLLVVASGVVLWWPRRFTRRALASASLLQRGLRGRARDFNWHNVLGSWSALPLLFVVATGVVISQPWASDLLYRMTGSEPPPPRSPAGRGGERSDDAAPALDGLDWLFSRAEAQVPDWRSLTLRLPRSADDPLVFTIDTGSGAVRPDHRAQLNLDRATAEVVRFEPYAAQSRGRQLRSWARWVHTGEAAGVLGQSVAALASAGAVVLVWTGLALSGRRLRAFVGRRRALAPPEGRVRPAATSLRASQESGVEP